MYYVVAGTLNAINVVWAHHGTTMGKPGCWARDFDAEYAPRLFGYVSKRSAQARAEWIADTGRGDPNSPFVYVVDRSTLFKKLDLEDWAKER